MRERNSLGARIKGYAVVFWVVLILVSMIGDILLCADGRVGVALLHSVISTTFAIGFYLFFAGFGEIVEKVCNTDADNSKKENEKIFNGVTDAFVQEIRSYTTEELWLILNDQKTCIRNRKLLL